MPECEPAVALFAACNTQWMYASTGMGAVRTGLNYAGVSAAAGMMGLDDLPWVFEGVRIIEHTLLDVDNERVKRDVRPTAESKAHRHR